MRRLFQLAFYTGTVLAAAMPPAPAAAATLYLCKSYGGGTFWSSAHCQQHRAFIERMVSVPDGMPFDQQVQMGNQAAAEGARLAAPPPQPSVTYTAPSTSGACDGLASQIRAIDAAARQPQSAAQQAQLIAQKKAARRSQAQLGCP